MALIAVTILITLVFSAFCSVSEASFYSISSAVVESLQKNKRFTAKYISHVKKNIDAYIVSVLILNTVTNTIGVYATTALAVNRLGRTEQIILPILLTMLILLFGEISPKTIGVKQANRVGPFVAVPFYYITLFFKWTGLIWISHTLTKRWTQTETNNTVTIEDISSLVSLGLRNDILDDQQALVIKNILALKSIYVRKAMTPRQVVFSLPAHLSLGEAIKSKGNWPFSRVPVYSDKPDQWVGLVLRRDVYNKLAEGSTEIPLQDLMRPIQLIPDSLTLDKLLLRFLKQRGHIVGVVDEWGAIAGIISLEDVLEEILGREIVDEYDETVDLQKHARRKSKALAFIKKRKNKLKT